MSSTLTNPTVNASLGGSLLPPNSAINQAVAAAAMNQFKLTVGNGAGQADGIVSMDRTVTAGTPDVIVLTALSDYVGYSVSCVRIVAVIIQSKSSTPGQTLTHGGGTNPYYAADPRPIGPSGNAEWASPIDGGPTVVGGTNNNLQVTASTGTVAYTIRMLTRSA
jgi:hypothetical protein